ncbi:MAG: hypothetical protein K5838_00840 [Elusimicrobiales bacterium]|nr:hypothetical protein [Elusimicrobiales bacterium]
MQKSAVIFYSLSGCTRYAAEIIAKKTGAQLIELKLEKPYSKAGAYTKGVIDLWKNIIPALKNDFSSLRDTDVFYIGGPVWFFTVPPPLRSLAAIQSFAEKTEGKKIIPFCTDGGNKGKFFEDMSKIFPKASFCEGKELKHILRLKPEELEAEIEEWLKEIGKQ